MRLTTRTNLAMRTLMYCAINPDRIVRKHEIASSCNASENHLAQVIHMLAQKGYLRTVRGRAGGLRLARPPSEINLGDIFDDFESCLPFAECFGSDCQNGVHSASCPMAGCCQLKGVLSEALDAFYARLRQTSVADLVAGSTMPDSLDPANRMPETAGTEDLLRVA